MSEIIRMLDKIDKLDERLDNIDKTLVRQEGHLNEHIRRTEQNEIMIKQALHHNQFNAFSKVEVPKKIKHNYKKTNMSFKVNNIISYYVEPTKEKDMIINISQVGEVRALYDPLVESKLELYFNGE